MQDTGPGIDENRAAPFAQELNTATEAADDARDASTDRRRDIPSATTQPSASAALPQSQQPGEGVGLSIVNACASSSTPDSNWPQSRVRERRSA